ncbi:MAG: winged helix-turn-helix transcriptional regulator [Sphingomonas oligoaromativorans]|jgi:DNA-binding HxlR family transcriptional regulator|uniref:winged helix-turn-helix transcriptional regulator n=1 Tax=Sphingomonas oligoaromativorans TaxID=575322 RepID=UPI0014222BEB|nr:helix-turn-helix domain-containing protein [Sphingomonas oligoaromativorans]NIJ34899.1 DNA-binding HxlR family transcriptional regulator [Sphingomonas oligoaromativorans]
MDAEKFSEGPCPVARALLRVGDAWSMMILRDAGYGATRFDQFRQSLGIAPNILTRRLAALTEAGLLEKSRYSERPPRDEYVLTPKGRDFLPVLAAIGAWGREHFGEGGTSRFVDAETGAPVEPVVVDRATGRPLGEIRIRLVMPDER